jgi:hypothetical protein
MSTKTSALLVKRFLFTTVALQLVLAIVFPPLAAAAPAADVISDMLTGLIASLKTIGVLVITLGILLYAIQLAFPAILQKIGIQIPQDYLFGLVIAGILFANADTIAGGISSGCKGG